AFYWLTALTEVRWVYIGQPNLTQNALRQSMIEHFQSLAAVIQPQLVYDYTEGPFPLGLTWVVLAISGLVIGLVVLKKRERLELAYWGLVVLMASLALTDALSGFWLSLPRLWVIQFAWRLTVFISLGGA